jgi:NAD(P)-dependent dehydrogenase (short-subunit alcohol dehydrogenase family)
MSFKDRTVMLTGAAGNLGQALAAAFAQQGARLVLLGRQTDAMRIIFGEEGPDRLYLATDLLDAQQVSAAFNAAVHRFARVDVLCNLAGGFRMGPAVHQTEDSTWDFLEDINVRTMLNMVRAVVPHMIECGGGKIVNVGAFAAQRGVAAMGAYCAAKSSVVRLTESMAAELREKHINVNCVLPTIMDTPENRAAMPDADPARWVAPKDLANVIVFLASPAARAIHGVALPVTGLS